jgi:ATP-dependent Clp protease ATP-binding subunit ClpC
MLVVVFDRFTDRARRVLVLAQDEAMLLNHDFVGSEHILLGLIREGEGIAAHVLESLGIALVAARIQVVERVKPAASGTAGSPPFTPRAKKVLELSLREALQFGHHYIGTEHLLLGLVREGAGVGVDVLVSLGVDLPRVRRQVFVALADRTMDPSKLAAGEGGPALSEVGKPGRLSDEAAAGPSEAAARAMLNEAVNAALSELSERERRVLRLRFRLDEGETDP